MKKFAIIATLALGAVLTTTGADAASMLSNHMGVNISYGSRGTRVMELQSCMNAAGYNTGVVDGIYGPNTNAGVRAFQASKGLVVDGIVGVATTPAFQAACMTGTDSSDDSSDDSDFDSNNGEEGDIEAITVDAADDADELSRDKKNQEAYIITIEADEDGSDIQVNRMDLTFATTATPGEDDLYDIFEAFTVEVDGNEVASKDTDDDSDWRTSSDNVLRLSGLDTVVKAGEEVEFTIFVDTADLDLTDLQLDMDLTDVSVRFIDEAGITTTMDENGLTEGISITALDDFDMDFSEADDNEDVATTLNLSDAVSKETIFVTDVEVDDNQDGTLTDLDVTLDINAIVAGNVDDIIKKVYVYIDGTKVDDDKTATPLALAAGAADYVFSFDLDDFDVNKDDEFEVAIMVDFEDLDATQEGTTVTVKELAFDGEDEEGDDFSAAVVTSITETMPSYAEVVTLSTGSLVEEDLSIDGFDHVGGSEALAKASFTLELKADGDADITLDHVTFDIDGTPTDVFDIATGTVTIAGVDYIVEIKEDDDNGDDIATLAGAMINEGDTETYYIEFTATATAGTVEEIELELVSVQYDITAGAADQILLIEKEIDSTVVELA